MSPLDERRRRRAALLGRNGKGRGEALLRLGAALAGLLATAACGATRPVAPPSADRTVVDNVLISPSRPALAIRVDPAIPYLGAHPIRIRDVAAGERHVFAAVEDGRAKRLVVLQFEGFLDGIDNTYRYDLSRSPVVAGYPFRGNGFAFDMDRSVREEPSGEAAGTHAFLKAHGIEPPRHWMMWRSLTVADPDRRHELILFYAEDAQDRGLTVDDLYRDDRETEVWLRLQEELEIAAHRAIALAPLDADGKARSTAWESIPLRPQS